MQVFYIVTSALVCVYFVYLSLVGALIFDLDKVTENKPLGARQFHK